MAGLATFGARLSRYTVGPVCWAPQQASPPLGHSGFRLFFYANEGHPREPPHIHVEQSAMEAKFWLRPEVHLAYNDGFSARALREVLRLVEANRERIEKAWNGFFG